MRSAAERSGVSGREAILEIEDLQNRLSEPTGYWRSTQSGRGLGS